MGIRAGLSTRRALLAVAFVLVVAVALLEGTGRVGPLFATQILVVAAWFVASSFDAVRAHRAYDLASAVWLGSVFLLAYLSEGGGLLLTALVVLAGLGVAVELYNYRNDASVLRFDA